MPGILCTVAKHIVLPDVIDDIKELMNQSLG